MNPESKDQQQEYPNTDRNTANGSAAKINDAVGTYAAQLELDTRTEVSQDLIDEIDSLYQYLERDDVVNFLLDHPEIAGILPEAYKAIRSYFPVEVYQLRYSPYMDSLYLDILSEETVDSTRARFNALDAAWYQPLAKHIRASFNINVSYV